MSKEHDIEYWLKEIDTSFGHMRMFIFHCKNPDIKNPDNWEVDHNEACYRAAVESLRELLANER